MLKRRVREFPPHVLLAALVAAFVQTGHGFVWSPTVVGSCIRSKFYHAAPYREAPYCEARSRRVNVARIPRGPLYMGSGEGIGGSVKGKGKGGGRGGKGKGGTKKGKSKPTSTRIPGPPRLETVPQDQLDTIFVFREGEDSGRVPRVIECYADRLAVVGGRRYMIGHPCDWAVSICVPKDEHDVEAVPLDSELMNELIPGLQRELEQEDVHLFVTPITLTLQGEFLDDGEEEDEEEDEEENDDDPLSDDVDADAYQQYGKVGRGKWGDEEVEFEIVDEGDGSYPSEEEEEAEQDERVATDINVEGVELIASYWYEDKEYALVRHLDPVFVIARQTPSGYYLLGPQEADAVKPKVEEMLLKEVELAQAVEDTLGKEDIDRELDAAFEAHGGEDADLSKAFPMTNGGGELLGVEGVQGA